MRESLSPYMGRGTWKNVELVPLGWGGVHEIRVWGGRREKRYETCQQKQHVQVLFNLE